MTKPPTIADLFGDTYWGVSHALGWFIALVIAVPFGFVLGLVLSPFAAVLKLLED